MWTAARAAYVQTGGSQQSGDLTADGAGADDEDPRAGHAAGLAVPPLMAALEVVALVEELGVSEHRRQHELRDGPVEGAARIGDHDVGRDQPREQQRVDARGSHVDPLQVGATVPHLLHRRGEEIPEEQHLRAHDGVGQTPGVGETEFELAAQRVEMTRALVEILTKHNDNRRLGRSNADHPVNLGSSCLIVNNPWGIMEPWKPAVRPRPPLIRWGLAWSFPMTSHLTGKCGGGYQRRCRCTLPELPIKTSRGAWRRP